MTNTEAKASEGYIFETWSTLRKPRIDPCSDIKAGLSFLVWASILVPRDKLD